MRQSITTPAAIDFYTPYQQEILEAIKGIFGSEYYDTNYLEEGSYISLGYCYKITHLDKQYDIKVILSYSVKYPELFRADISDNADIEDPSLQYTQISSHFLQDTIDGLEDFWVSFLDKKVKLKKEAPRWKGLRPDEVSFDSFNFTPEIHEEFRFDFRGNEDAIKLCQAFLNKEIEAHELAFALEDIQKRVKEQTEPVIF